MEEDDPVLVVLLKTPRDLEILEREHWYRVPAKHAPANLGQAAYLAFYQSKRFGDGKWSIRGYAPLRGHELVLRSDLFPEESAHSRAGEPYYKLQVGPWVELPRPIVSRSGRRILFIWTTGRKFSRAVEINDLFHKSAADDALWDRLKENHIPAERQIVVRDATSRYRVDFWVPCVHGQLAIVLAGPGSRMARGARCKCVRLSEAELTGHPDDCWKKIATLLHELGGAQYTCAE